MDPLYATLEEFAAEGLGRHAAADGAQLMLRG
jgi:hypothetical protein